MAEDGAGPPLQYWPGHALPGAPPPHHAPPDAYHFAPPAPSLAPPRPSIPPPAHCCTVHPPGFPRAFDVPFPERRLPVCDRCKRNFKSRDLCRKRDGHRSLPWQATYVAITLDDSVLVEGPDGHLTCADVPVAATLAGTPLMCLGPADGSMASEPICKVCREKNHTRDHCRNASGHTTPPWNTTYVRLVADPNPQKRQPKKKYKKSVGTDEPCGRPAGIADGDDDALKRVHESRTFLLKFSSKMMTVRVRRAVPVGRGRSSRAVAGVVSPVGHFLHQVTCIEGVR